MERVTFPRPDVQRLLSTMVCMKVDAGGASKPPVAARFGVRGFPTLVLLSPTGDTLYNDGGAPHPDDFSRFFAYKPYNAAVVAFNKKDYAGAAPHLFLVTKWFGTTKLGKEAKGMVEQIQDDKAFLDAYEAARAKHAEKLERARAAIRKEEDRRKRAREAMEEANELYGKYLRTKAFKKCQAIILEYPDLPVADEARAMLRKHKKKWKEPGGR